MLSWTVDVLGKGTGKRIPVRQAQSKLSKRHPKLALNLSYLPA